ncbi:unnamed protein product [Closterium sp. Yama58-4]|nr:unnamed protein product [Closterium sp. Yama58-4]
MATVTASQWGDESAAPHFSKFALHTDSATGNDEWRKQPPALVNAADPRFPDSAVDLSDICGDSDSDSVANLSDICGFNDLNSPRSAVSSPRSGLGSAPTSQPNSANNSGALSIISDTPSNTSSGNSRPSTGRVSLAQQLLQQQMGGNARFTSVNSGSKNTNVASVAGISDYGSYTGSPVTPLMPSFSCASSDASGQSPANRAWRQSSDPRAVSQQTATMRESSLREKLLRASSAAASETSSQSSWHEHQSQAASAYSARESASAADDYYCEPEENEQGELDFSDIKSVCLNFDEAQQQSEEMEFQRARLETVDIILEERAFLVGVEVRPSAPTSPSPLRLCLPSSLPPLLSPLVLSDSRGESFSGGSREESLAELSQLVETAGLKVVGRTHQRVASPNPRTYIGAGKVEEVRAAVAGMGVETVVFDDELSAGQLRNLEKEFGGDVRVCDRTALIIDIFSQRANTKEATLQVQLAQLEYQLPRLTRMWTHLERQAGGMVKGMGEKQIEVDKRIIRERMAALRRSLTSVREHRQQHRDRRAGLPIPVLSLVGYTNAGKSTLLNRLTGAGVLAEDKLFATLDPTTRRTQLPNGKECLLTDTVGFIQKLPTQLVAAFRATLEEITEASVLLHVVDVSHPMAAQQVAAVLQVLAELDVSHIPMLTVLNKVDQVSPDWLQQQQRQLEAILDQNPGGRESSVGGRDGGGREGGRHRMVAVSAVTGEGMDGLFHELEKMVNGLLVSIDAIIPYQEGHLLGLVYQLGAVDREEHLPEGTLLSAHVPLRVAQLLLPYRWTAEEFKTRDATVA